VAWVGDLRGLQIAATVGGVLALALLALESVLLLNVLRQSGRLLLRLEAVEGSLGVQPEPAPGAQPEVPQPGLPVAAPAPPSRSPGSTARR
jgi:hypothetical protein